MSNSTETVMQFIDEHVNKRFQVHIFQYCVIIGYEKKPSWAAIIKQKYGCDPSSVIKIFKLKYNNRRRMLVKRNASHVFLSGDKNLKMTI
jgi:hypothetical protein